MNGDEKEKSWLEEEICSEKSKIKEPSQQDKIGRNRDNIASRIRNIGFVRKRHIGQSEVGRTYSYEQYELYLEQYNMKIICAIGSEAIYVGARDLESKECYYLFEYTTQGTYMFASEPSRYIEEFKFLLKHSFFQCLEKIGKEKNMNNYQLYNLDYDMLERNPDTILNVFCDK